MAIDARVRELRVFLEAFLREAIKNPEDADWNSFVAIAKELRSSRPRTSKVITVALQPEWPLGVRFKAIYDALCAREPDMPALIWQGGMFSPLNPVGQNILAFREEFALLLTDPYQADISRMSKAIEALRESGGSLRPKSVMVSGKLSTLLIKW
jgi:hypothetical protein